MSKPTEEDLRQVWECFATQDPLWAIISDPAERGRRWDLQRFFETGRREISVLLQLLRQLHPRLKSGTALDFGCGVGRLSQALAGYFANVIGIDVSPTMIRIAERLNRHGDQVRYWRNEREDLSMLGDGSIDLVYSNIVLQHVRSEQSIVYIKDFIRVLSADGIAVFQLPSHKRAVADQRRPEPMAPDAYKATVSIQSSALRLQPSESVTLIAEVNHIGSGHWRPAEHDVIRLGNHWLTGDGTTMLIQDDGRATLPREVSPGESLTVPIRITAPDTPGPYTCEFDLVHEGVTWFKDRGSPATRIPVEVGNAEGPERSVGSEDEAASAYPDIYSDLPALGDKLPDFPMFGVPRDTVSKTIIEAGGVLILAEVDEHGGPEWVGYRYFVKKA